MRARVVIAVGSDEMRRQTWGDPLHERRAGGFFLGKLPPHPLKAYLSSRSAETFHPVESLGFIRQALDSPGDVHRIYCFLMKLAEDCNSEECGEQGEQLRYSVTSVALSFRNFLLRRAPLVSRQRSANINSFAKRAVLLTSDVTLVAFMRLDDLAFACNLFLLGHEFDSPSTMLRIKGMQRR